MKTSYYFRSEILSYFDLTEVERTEIDREGTPDMPSDTRQYVKGVNRKTLNVEILPLDMFMRIDTPGIWQGVYGITAFSAYFIRFNRSNDECIVAYRYN